MAQDESFLSRWSRRKVQVHQETQKGLPPAPDAAPALPLPQPGVAGMGPAAVPGAAGQQAAPVALAAETRQEPPAPPAVESVESGPPAPPSPTLEEALQLSPTSADFSRFVAQGVDPQVQHTALKTLFSDPHFNVMDRLDTYIDDYNTPDPLPAGMLRQMVQSTLLGLFDEAPRHAADQAEQAEPAEAAALTPPEPPPQDEDPAVRLQPYDDTGPASDQPGPVEDPGRQH